jgi:hypothetical protein
MQGNIFSNPKIITLFIITIINFIFNIHSKEKKGNLELTIFKKCILLNVNDIKNKYKHFLLWKYWLNSHKYKYKK